MLKFMKSSIFSVHKNDVGYWWTKKWVSGGVWKVLHRVLTQHVLWGWDFGPFWLIASDIIFIQLGCRRSQRPQPAWGNIECTKTNLGIHNYPRSVFFSKHISYIFMLIYKMFWLDVSWYFDLNEEIFLQYPYVSTIHDLVEQKSWSTGYMRNGTAWGVQKEVGEEERRAYLSLSCLMRIFACHALRTLPVLTAWLNHPTREEECIDPWVMASTPGHFTISAAFSTQFAMHEELLRGTENRHSTLLQMSFSVSISAGSYNSLYCPKTLAFCFIP